MSKIIVFATPVFILLMLLEFAWGLRRGRNTYRLNDALNSLSLGMLSQWIGVFSRLFNIGIYGAVYAALTQSPQPFWLTPWGWLLALLLYDLCYYWLHRLGHECAILWAAHVVHHQSQDYNLSTALRQTSSGMLLGWLFYLPLALLGVPPLVFGAVAMIDLLYQFWVHTEHVPKLGWFDRWFCSPSNHRVHHAINDAYLDKNFGGILIVWDRLFGSFIEEGERCVYGTRSPLNSWDPLWANLEVYRTLALTSWRAPRWRDKLAVWLRPPGWQPDGLEPEAKRFTLEAVTVFNPPLTRAAQQLALLQFLLLLGGTLAFLWQADDWPLLRLLPWFAALCVALWGLGALLQNRLRGRSLLALDALALACALLLHVELA